MLEHVSADNSFLFRLRLRICRTTNELNRISSTKGVTNSGSITTSVYMKFCAYCTTQSLGSTISTPLQISQPIIAGPLTKRTKTHVNTHFVHAVF